MPLELRELIIQARVDSSAAAASHEKKPQLSPEERQEIIEDIMERLEERLAAATQHR